jgi:hypothetical protein
MTSGGKGEFSRESSMRVPHFSQVGKISNAEKKIIKNQWPQAGIEGEFC